MQVVFHIANFCLCEADGTALNALIAQCDKLNTLSLDCHWFPRYVDVPALSNITSHAV